MLTATFCSEIAGAVSEAVVGEIRPSHFGFTNLCFREPVGPVLIIPPYVQCPLYLHGLLIADGASVGMLLSFLQYAELLLPWQLDVPSW